MLQNLVLTSPEDVDARLQDLGLERDPIVDVVKQGYFAYISSTDNHPPLYPGFVAWAEMVKGLREYLLPKQWTRCDKNNYSRVVNPNGTVSIAVATGDPGTGQAHSNPTTNAPKGPSTVEAVSLNLDFFKPEPNATANSSEDDELLTWILLVHRISANVLCELSLPLSMGDDGRVDLWRERLIIGSIPLDPDPVKMTPPSLPDIDVDVKRRA